jgi:hypothetical protein
MRMTTDRVLVGTRPATSLHQRSVAEGVTDITVTYVTSSTIDMHVTGLKADAEIEIATT